MIFKKIGQVAVKFLTKTLVGRAVDNVVLGGAVTSTTVKTSSTNEGKVDIKEIILQLVSSTIPVIIIVAFLKGWITIEEVKALIKIFIP